MLSGSATRGNSGVLTTALGNPIRRSEPPVLARSAPVGINRVADGRKPDPTRTHCGRVTFICGSERNAVTNHLPFFFTNTAVYREISAGSSLPRSSWKPDM
jgi:hypothetical protein